MIAPDFLGRTSVVASPASCRRGTGSVVRWRVLVGVLCVISSTALGCAPKAPLIAADVSTVQQFGLTARGHSFGGLGAVRIDATGFELEALSPAGGTMFTVGRRDDASSLVAPDPAMAAALEQLPFERDLSLALRWRCDSPAAVARCEVPGGVLVERRDPAGSLEQARYRGPGGPAVLRVDGALTRITDPLRGYVLVLRDLPEVP